MKKIVILSAIILTINLTSCKKAYTCECTTTEISSTVNGVSQSSTGSSKQVTTKQISKTSKKNAQAICGNSTDVYTSTYSDASSSTNTTYVDNLSTNCTLK